MLIDELSKANMEALKAHDQVARAVYSVIISKYKATAIELKAQGKDATDADLVKIITKSIKELEKRIKDLEEENAILKKAAAIFAQNQKI